jgi:hypothetical protein
LANPQFTEDEGVEEEEDGEELSEKIISTLEMVTKLTGLLQHLMKENEDLRA